MPNDADAILHDYVRLKDEVEALNREIERQRQQIEDLMRPRHWTQDGPRGAQATAIHHALDRALERAVSVRDLIRPRPPSSPAEIAQGQRVDAVTAAEVADGAYLRLSQAADLLGRPPRTGERALDAFIASVTVSDRPISTLAWLGFVAVLGRYPTTPEFGLVHRALRSGGPGGLRSELQALHMTAITDGAVSTRPLAVHPGAVLVDVDHTARHDLHTGIQRVVRETVMRWLDDERVTLVWWDSRNVHLRALGVVETYRFREWASFLPSEAESAPIVRDFADTPDAIVVPWDAAFILPELAADHRRSSCYVPLVESGLVTRFGAIGYDLVPLTSAETVHEGMVGVFPSHISIVKHADRISVISGSAAQEFRGLWQGLGAQGLPAPRVEAHPLPATVMHVDDDAVNQIRRGLDDDVPVVLVVGSREPRKNQISVLEAVRRLWSAGHRFHLVMVGGSGWYADDVNDEIDRLRSIGVSITVRTRAGEEELFAWYRLARFSVFPSLHEGYGLPIAESLASGTPVITSHHGAMAEVAAPGGSLLIDPRDPAEIFDAMSRLLTDDDLVGKLASEASQHTWPSWDRYAHDVWAFLLDEDVAS